MNEDLTLTLDDDDDVSLEDIDDIDLSLDNDMPYYKPGVDDYEELKNKPQINGRTIIGNQTVEYILQDGLIINGGDSTGYSPPVIPSDVPRAGGVNF